MLAADFACIHRKALVPATVVYKVRCFVEIRSVCAQHVPYFSRTLLREAKKSYRGELVTEISKV